MKEKKLQTYRFAVQFHVSYTLRFDTGDEMMPTLIKPYIKTWKLMLITSHECANQVFDCVNSKQRQPVGCQWKYEC